MAKTRTKEELRIHEEEKEMRRQHRAAISNIKKIIKDLCVKKGLRTAQLQVEYAKSHKTELPKSILSPSEILEMYDIAIREYKESLNTEL